MSDFELREVHSCSCGAQVIDVKWYGGTGPVITMDAEPVTDGWVPTYQFPDYFTAAAPVWKTHFCENWER